MRNNYLNVALLGVCLLTSACSKTVESIAKPMGQMMAEGIQTVVTTMLVGTDCSSGFEATESKTCVEKISSPVYWRGVETVEVKKKNSSQSADTILLYSGYELTPDPTGKTAGGIRRGRWFFDSKLMAQQGIAEVGTITEIHDDHIQVNIQESTSSTDTSSQKVIYYHRTEDGKLVFSDQKTTLNNNGILGVVRMPFDSLAIFAGALIKTPFVSSKALSVTKLKFDDEAVVWNCFQYE